MIHNVKNGNMFQKSMIQQIMEQNAAVNSFKASLEDILEKYTVVANAFAFRNNKTVEINEGYMVVDAEVDNLYDAIKEMKDFSYCIRIIENKTFQVGHLVQFASDGGDNRVIDLDNQTEVMR